MKTFRITRHVTQVQWTVVEAENEDEARDMAWHDPHLLHWNNSSDNDPEITDVSEVKS
jgi:hypothetical protein